MANTISTSFIAQYNAEVKLAYQRGQLLRGTVRTAEATGSTHTFQKIGTGTATIKARNGNIVPMNPEHSVATATLVDRYAPEYIDSLDQLKQNIDERSAMVQTAVRALQRYADSQIIALFDAHTGTSTSVITYAGTGMTIAKIGDWIYRGLFGNDVPDDGDVTAAIGWKQYGELMALQQFSGWEYVGDTRPWLKASNAVRWMNVTWIPHSGLTTNSTSGGVTCFAYHKSAIGHAIGQELKTEINWMPEKVAWLINAYLSMGAVTIDSNGISMAGCY
jgi:hypothetical protein